MPASAEAYAGVCSLGGNMSANDPLPWIDEELAFMRDAVERGVPIIGHCLGGQLLAKALGAAVDRNPCKEMGWLPVDVVDPVLVNEWLGSAAPGELFHWHGDAFELPQGARRLLSSPLAPNQAYVVERAGTEHLGMQFHIEMTPELVNAWAGRPRRRPRSRGRAGAHRRAGRPDARGHVPGRRATLRGDEDVGLAAV